MLRAVDGPYVRWLRNAREIVGEVVWDRIQELPSMEADAILASLGVVSYADSVEAWKHARTIADPTRSPDVTMVDVSDRTSETEAERSNDGRLDFPVVHRAASSWARHYEYENADMPEARASGE